jgi:hypothetical protein
LGRIGNLAPVIWLVLASLAFAALPLFVAYFPHLIAGPILHHKDMIPQFERAESKRPDAHLILCGLIIFAIGLFKTLSTVRRRRLRCVGSRRKSPHMRLSRKNLELAPAANFAGERRHLRRIPECG